ncbi:MAG: hypothetical protein LBH00_07315, partial [Planctomycetaceae bacterium]|nr:hypothetical protein [Planctomycetaceae bacterium]
MTIWFSTNIPEMRAISTFNRVSTDISEIQRRITTGQRINSGKDDPGGLILRETMRADIKQINAQQASLNQAEFLMDAASGGISQLLKIINGDPANTSDNGIFGILYDTSTSDAQKTDLLKPYITLYDAAVNSALYNGQKLIGGDLAPSSTPSPNDGKTYQLGGGTTLQVTIADLSSDIIKPDTNAPSSVQNKTLADLLDVESVTTTGTSAPTLADVQAGVRNILDQITTASGLLGNNQNVVAQAQRLLDSRLTSVTEAEGKISNADIAYESSRMARAELLAQNAMNSIMYSRNYA